MMDVADNVVSVVLVEECSAVGQCATVMCTADIDCPAGSQCDLSTLQCVCAPQCDGKSCGDDGCGGLCGICPLGAYCIEGGLCEQLDCTTDEQCPDGSSCISGSCVCTPQCGVGQECGSDGCGGECGQCDLGSTCSVTGVCATQPNDCSEAFLCTLNCLAIANGNVLSCFDQCIPATGTDAFVDWFFCIEPSCTNLPNDLSCISTNPECELLAADCQSGTCSPDCSGKECGNDGCGGSCGTCGADTACNSSGQCVAGNLECSDSYTCLALCLDTADFDACALQCEPLLSEQVLLYQELLTCLAPTCSVPGAGSACLSTPDCQTEVELCISAQCQPDCTGKDCGSDGCNGSCGVCGLGEACMPDGICEAIGCQSDNDCPPGTGCNLATATCGCVPQCDGKQCGDDTCGGVCGTCPGGADCLPDNTCPKPLDCPAALLCLEECLSNGTNYFTCYDSCTPSDSTALFDFDNLYFCAFSACTGSNDPSCLTQDAACAANYSACAAVCEPNCVDKQCGSDGCGGTCGACGAFTVCSADGLCIAKPTTCAGAKQCYATCHANTGDVTTCVFVCEPTNGTAQAISDFFAWTNCVEAICLGLNGDPACVDFDPACQTLAEACETDACTPECAGKDCGPDGCGGSCGTCALGDECSQAGVCEDIACTDDTACGPGTACVAGVCECVPQCSGKACGADGCGVSCGTSSDGDECFYDGQCYGQQTTCAEGSTCVEACIGTGIGAFDCLGLCAPPEGTPARNAFNEWFACILASCEASPGDTTCLDVPACSAAYDACQTELCIPDCSLRECGGDGCDGSCGSCDSGTVCSIQGVCQPDAAALVINEVDRATGTATPADFIELYNAGTQPMPLLGVTIEVLSASAPASPTIISLPDASMAPGDYMVVGDEAAVLNAPQGTLTLVASLGFTTNEAFGVVLRSLDSSTLDGVAAGADLAPATETNSAAFDLGADGLSRCPNGLDSNNNGLHFVLVPVSPGTSICPVCQPNCAGSSCGSDGCGGLCGVCGTGEVCDSGACVGVGCTSDAECPQGTACNIANGQCECAPNCDGKQCGGDGCGGECGHAEPRHNAQLTGYVSRS